MTEDTAIQLAQPQQLQIVPSIPRSVFQLSQEHFQRIQFMAKMYAMSSFNAGDTRRTEGDYFIIMVKGMELGLSLTAAVEFIGVIKGKPVTDGKGMLALIRNSPKCKSIVIDSQDDTCTVRMVRTDGDEYAETWTLDRANKFMVYEKGGMVSLSSRPQWRSMPKTMLKWRAVTDCARALFSDVIGGLYTREEMSDGDVVVQDDGTMTHAPLPEPEPEPPTKWWENNDALLQLAERCKANGFIEYDGSKGIVEMRTLLFPKTFSDFDTRADAANAIRAEYEAFKAELEHKATQEDKPAEPPAPEKPAIRGRGNNQPNFTPPAGLNVTPTPEQKQRAGMAAEDEAAALKDLEPELKAIPF